MKGKVIKNIADKFEIVDECGKRHTNCLARGNLKCGGKLLVGDEVKCEEQGSQVIIVEIGERKNQFVRPPIANIDIMLIVVSEKPLVDLLLLDKLILYAKSNCVEPMIVINKEDVISKEFIAKMNEIYANSGVEIVVLSAKTGVGTEQLKEKIKGKIACLVGQSAVGKSSLLNLVMNQNEKVGELSAKVERGKNTTRHCEIFYDENSNLFIADTAGFSKFDIITIPYNKIESYYKEFDGFREQCYYKPCSHIFEKDCDCFVKNALKDCKINENRYNNYKQIYVSAKTSWEKRYD